MAPVLTQEPCFPSSPLVFLVRQDLCITVSYAAGIGSLACKLTVQNTDPSLQDLTRRYQTAFNAVCPALVKRFASRPNVTNNIIVTFKSDLPSDQGGSILGNQIGLNAAYLLKRPYEAVGELIFYLSLAIQNDSPDETASWFPGAMAFYVRSIYGPKDDDWVLPLSVEPTDTYQYSQGASFLHWLQQHTTPTLVDQLNRAIQTKQSFPAIFQRLTGGTVDQLWNQYKADPDLAPLQHFPTPDGTTSNRTIACKLTIQNTDPSLEKFIRRYRIAFKAVCPLLVKRFAHAIRMGPFFPKTFQSLTGGTVDELWEKYKANSTLGPTRRVRIPDK
jgi:basic secretory peptidase family protein